ncbi:MAG: sensor histidine kinase [Gammaproteobacteria bacterium]|nr:sensor histidine kinase [Gammaproteobacteria bacterium]
MGHENPSGSNIKITVATDTDAASSAGDLDTIARRVERISEENQHLFAQLLEGERRFRRLAKGVWKVQEEERRRLALELHDGIGQTLTALKHQLQRLEDRVDPELSQAFAELVDIATGALNDTRELSRLLRPPVLDDLGLLAALSWLQRTLQQRVGLEVSLSDDGFDDQRLDTDIETLVFRVVQESLTNIVKHAEVSKARVALKREQSSLTIEIEDKGKGFDFESKMSAGGSNDSSGLRGVRDRLALFSGTLSVESGKKSGTRLTMHVPLPENDKPGG